MKKRLLFVAFGLILSIIALEIGLHVAKWHERKEVPGPFASIPDSRLGHRPNSSYPGHDSNGFRNSKVPASAHIVTFGDSQTYGTGVALEEIWPGQLEFLLDVTVYNMAFGGYGPAHSLMLWDDAMRFNPKVILEAFYAGNDLYDSFNLIYHQGQLKEFGTSNLQQRELIRSLEESDPIRVRVNRLYQLGTKVGSLQPEGSAFFSKHSKLYGLLQRARYNARRRIYKPKGQGDWETALSIVEAHPDPFDVFVKGRFKTILTTEYRFHALNLDDPRIAEGLQISLQAIGKMGKLAEKRKIDFIVLLIPTKEAVFGHFPDQTSSEYRSLIEMEKQVWNATKAFLDENRIPYLDTLPALQKQFDHEIQPYPVTTDGHPNRSGHEAIGKLVASYLQSHSQTQ